MSSKHKLNNLVILIDYNKIQALDKLEDALPLDNLKKLSSFNMNVINVKNDIHLKSYQTHLKNKIKKTNVIILNTIKGKGVKEFENDPVWHARKLSDKEVIIAKQSLGII